LIFVARFTFCKTFVLCSCQGSMLTGQPALFELA